MPSPYLILGVQFTIGLAMYVLVARHYVLPRLARLDFHAALAPVLLVQGFRFLGMTLLAPDQAASGQDIDALTTIALGDLASSVLGVLAAAAAFRRSSATVPLAWAFTAVGLGDLAIVGVTVASAGVLESGVGFIWVLLGVYAPILTLSHVYVLWALLRRRRTSAAPVATTA